MVDWASFDWVRLAESVVTVETRDDLVARVEVMNSKIKKKMILKSRKR